MTRWIRGAGGAARLAAGLLPFVAGCAFVVGVLWRRAVEGAGIPSPDTYGYSLPIFRYAQAAWSQGHGWLWNDLQNSGQPFLGIPSSGLLYPPTALALPFEASHWLLAQAIFHLGVAGLGSFALARELGLGRIASLGSAVAFELGGVTIGLATWSPLVLGTYVWIPAAMAVAERLLRTPGAGPAIGLGTVLTLQLCAGFPQIVIFTYELLVLRIAWDCVTRRPRPRLRSLSYVVMGLGLPVVLGAVIWIPGLEVMRDSVRAGAGEPPLTFWNSASWPNLRAALASRQPNGGGPGGLLSVIGVLLAGAGAFAPRRGRRLALFFLLAAALFASLVPDSPVRHLYERIPVAGTLRNPVRFLWISAFALSVLTGFGVEALRAGERERRRQIAFAAAAALASVVALHALIPSGLALWEWALAGAALLTVAVRPSASAASSAALVTLLAIGLVSQGGRSQLRLLADEAPLQSTAAAFAAIRARWTPQDRVYCQPHGSADRQDLGLAAKAPSLHGLPSIVDYEHLTSRRYAEIYVSMVKGVPLISANQWIQGRMRPPMHRPLFDLLAARWLVAHASESPPWSGLELVFSDGGYRVFENTQALPRAFFVPTARVIESDLVRLWTLIDLAHDARSEALLEAAPADGFLGRPGGDGVATIARSQSEELEIRVSATQEGFLFVSDQHLPGWTATVNGERASIARANHAFRLVRVLDGESTVVFRYRPWGLYAGAVISLLGLLGIVLWTLSRRVLGESQAASGATSPPNRTSR